MAEMPNMLAVSDQGGDGNGDDLAVSANATIGTKTKLSAVESA